MCLALVAEGWGENTGGGMGGDKFSIQAPQPQNFPGESRGPWMAPLGWIGAIGPGVKPGKVRGCDADRASRSPSPLWGGDRGAVAEGSALWAHPHPQSLPTRGREAWCCGWGGNRGKGRALEGRLLRELASRSPSPLWGGGRGGGGRGLGALGPPPPSIPPHKGEGSWWGPAATLTLGSNARERSASGRGRGGGSWCRGPGWGGLRPSRASGTCRCMRHGFLRR